MGQKDQITNEVRPLLSLRDLTSQDLRAVLEDYARDFPEIAAELKAMDAEYTVVKRQPSVRPAALLEE